MGTLVVKIRSLRGKTRTFPQVMLRLKLKSNGRFNYMKENRVGKGRNIPDISMWILFSNRWHIQKLTENNLRPRVKKNPQGNDEAQRRINTKALPFFVLTCQRECVESKTSVSGAMGKVQKGSYNWLLNRIISD